MKLTINGESREVPAGITVEGLLGHLQVDPQRVAVEVDRKVVQRDRWGQQALQEGSAVEIVQFVGGG